MRVKQARHVLWPLACICGAVCLARAGGTISSGAAVIRKHATIHGTRIEVAVHLLSEGSTIPYKGGFWGAEDVQPHRVIQRLIATPADGLQLYMPLSAFADLADPDSVVFAKAANDSTFAFTLCGGRAPRKYRATLTCNQSRVLFRRVVDVRDPEDFWEETRFSALE